MCVGGKKWRLSNEGEKAASNEAPGPTEQGPPRIRAEEVLEAVSDDRAADEAAAAGTAGVTSAEVEGERAARWPLLVWRHAVTVGGASWYRREGGQELDPCCAYPSRG